MNKLALCKKFLVKKTLITQMKPTTPINDLYQKVSKMKGLVVEESNHEIILDSKLRNPPLTPRPHYLVIDDTF